jgi:hypothetical protein
VVSDALFGSILFANEKAALIAAFLMYCWHGVAHKRALLVFPVIGIEGNFP